MAYIDFAELQNKQVGWIPPTPLSHFEMFLGLIVLGLMKLELEEINNQGWIRLNKKIRIKFGLDIAKILGFNFGEWSTF